MTTEYIIEFDEKKCVGCHACVVACKAWRELPLGLAWRRVIKIWSGSFPDVKLQHASVNCQHCVQPECVASCPTNSISKSSKNGRVLVSTKTCIGCEACADACPYGVPAFGADGTMQKCDLCIEKLDHKNDTPACVATCPTQALSLKKQSIDQKISHEKRMLALVQKAGSALD